MNSRLPLKARYVHRVTLMLPGFSKFASIRAPEYDAPAVVLSDQKHDSEKWYTDFRDRVFSTIGTGVHLPIFRMSHGEYIVMVGYQDALTGKLRRIVSRLLGRQGAYKSGDPLYGWEQYSDIELGQVRRALPEMIRRISEIGILAIALHPDNPGYSRFIIPALDYLDREDVDLTETNSCPFYFVYGLLLGQDRFTLFRKRRVLIVTGQTHNKFEQLQNGLARLGVADVQFLPCHPNKSMLDKLDVSRVKGKIDLTLVGAGVGAANVLQQLAPLRSVCIDAGYGLTVLGNPNLPRRAYALPDPDYSEYSLADVPRTLAEKAGAKPRVTNG